MQRVSNASDLVHAVPFASGSKDAALVLYLLPGGYTAQVSGKNSATGVGMIEVYEADTQPVDSRLINISTRSQTLSDGNIQIAGFIVGGSGPKKVLIRALGPKLAKYSVPNFLDDPVLTVFSGQTQIAQNDDWSSTSDSTASVQAATTAANAAQFDLGSTDSALVMTLPPGGYTAQVKGKSGHTGVTLIEVYEVP
jgi:hypothetical protein